MELAHLRTFLAIYRHENLSRAGEELHLSQPAVTSHLKSLEVHLGRPLFLRKARGVTATPLAHSLANDITIPLQSLVSTVSAYVAGTDRLDTTIYIGGPADALSNTIIPALVPLTTAGLNVHATTGETKALLERLSLGELDLVITTTPSRKRGIRLTPLFTETLALVAGQHLSTTLTNPTIEDLAAAPMLAYAENLQLIRRYCRDVFSATPPNKPRVVLGDLRGLISAATAGAGWTIVPTYLAVNELKSGSLSLLHRPENSPTNTLHIATLGGRSEGAVQTVKQTLLDAAIHW